MALPPPGYLSDATRTEGEMKAALEALRDALASITGSSVSQALVISAGVVSPIQGDFTVDTEGAAPTDDLTHITTAGLHDGALVYVRTADAARDVTIKHAAGGTGQVLLGGAVDLVLGDPKEWVQLRLKGTLWEEVERSAIATTPTGSIFFFPGSAPPTGYLLCDGSLISRATYPALFAVLGTTYGAGDGSTTFGLPNFNGRMPVGRDPADTAFDTLGEAAGAKTFTPTFTGNPLPTHQHREGVVTTGGGFFGDFPYGSDSVGSRTVYAGSSFTAAANRPHTDLQTAGTPTGTVQAVPLLNPYLVVNVIIKT